MTCWRRLREWTEADVRPALHEQLLDQLVAEAMTNAVTHARASVVPVEIDTDSGDHVLRIRVRDNDRGGADLAGGTGLVGRQDRVEALGGRLCLQSVPGAGTTLHAELPLSHAHKASD